MINNQAPITTFAQYTPAECFDPRCEYEVPRFLDLQQLDDIQEAEDEYLLMGMYEQDNQPRKITMEEEFYNWFQIAHDFKVPRKVQKTTKESALQNTYSNNSMTKNSMKNVQSSIADLKTVSSTGSQIQLQTQTQSTKSSGKGGMSDRNILSAKNRNSRNQLKRTQSQVMQLGISKLGNQSTKSIDLNLNSSQTFVNVPNLLTSQQSSLFQKVSKHQPTKSTVENVVIDLTATNSNSNVQQQNSTSNLITQKILNIKQQYKDIAPSGSHTSRERINAHHKHTASSNRLGTSPYQVINQNHSKTRTDYIQQNIERVKKISAHSRTRKLSTSQVGGVQYGANLNGSKLANVSFFNQNSNTQFEDTMQLKPAIKNISSQKDLIKSKNSTQKLTSSTNHCSNLSRNCHNTNSRSQLKTQRTNADKSKVDHTALAANLTTMIREPSSVKRKRNGRVNSMVWGASTSQSTQNLMLGLNSSKSNINLQHQIQQQSISNLNDQLHSFSQYQSKEEKPHKSPCGKNITHSINEKENMIQSQYLKQLLKMQQKYHNSKTGHKRNQTGVGAPSASGKVINMMGDFDKQINAQKSNLRGSKVTQHSFSKQMSSTNISAMLTNNQNAVNMDSSQNISTHILQKSSPFTNNTQNIQIQKGYYPVKHHSKKPSFNNCSSSNLGGTGSQTQRNPQVSQINLTNL
eukprot:403356394